MRTATTRVGAALMLVAASVAVSQATASAEPPVPNVKYILTSDTGVSFQVNYLVSQPPSMAAYNADPYAFLKKEEVPTPWEFSTTLDDPQWATLDASAAAHGGQAPPSAHCEIQVDGQVVSQADGPYTARCQLSKW
ncbi:hypothetical protein DVS77_28435 [Mycolicibacterium moriokaense]|nr:hypothetical protein DVS77_28435 [Mycolicibacterium moriokaense]